MFYAGGSSQGVCPADTHAHDGSWSAHYELSTSDGSPTAQGGWRWCHKCQGMFYAGGSSQGVCPADTQAHDGSQSGHYSIEWDQDNAPMASPGRVDFWGVAQGADFQRDVQIQGFTAATQLTAALRHSANHFTAALITRTARQEPLPEEDWPPYWRPPGGHPPNPIPTITVWEEGQLDPSTPVSVSPGDTVRYRITADTTGIAPATSETSTLTISGQGWAAPLTVPLSLFTNPFMVTVDSDHVTIGQGGSAVLGVTVKSSATQIERVTVSATASNGGLASGISVVDAAVEVPAGGAGFTELNIRAGSDVRVGRYSLRIVVAEQVLEVPLDVVAAPVSVTLTGSSSFTANPGDTVKVGIRISLNETTENTTIVFSQSQQIKGITVGGSFDLVNVPDFSHLPPLEQNLDSTGAMNTTLELHIGRKMAPVDNLVIPINWVAFGGAQTGTVTLNLTIPVRSATFRQNITSGGLAALGGFAEVTIFSDGTARWRGEAEDTGLDGYTYGVSGILKATTTSGTSMVALAHTGHVGGTITAGGRKDDWDEFARFPDGTAQGSSVSPTIQQNFDDLAQGNFSLSVQYASDIGDAFATVLSDATAFLAGATPVGALIGTVVFVGAEVGSLLTTGSLVPGARIVEGVLWLAGPSNTLLALTAEGIASLGDQARGITQFEYDWANNNVFSGSLPPMDQIVITDTIGAQNRPFVFPRYDGKITLNLGPDGFRDPLKIMTAPNGRLAEGEVFIHELTHAWQIRHTPMPLDWLAQALAARLCEISGGDPFHHYDPAGKPYSEFGMEEQAQIVQDWFAGNKHPDGTRFPPGSQLDPFFRYIQQNIRTGNYD